MHLCTKANWAAGAIALLVASEAWSNQCGDPAQAIESYFAASLERDAGAIYEMTATSKRGTLQDFLSSYHAAHSAPKVFREFFAKQANVSFEQISASKKVAQFYATGTVPDFWSVAIERAQDGHVLDTESDWGSLVTHMETHGYDTVTNQEEFYLICEESQWRVLEPLPF